MAVQTSAHLIDGGDVCTEHWFDVRGPESDEIVSRGARCSPHIVDKAIDSAQRAYQDWKHVSYIERRELFRVAADKLVARAAEISQVVQEEIGATKDWALGVNVYATADILREVSSLASQLKGEVIPSRTPGTTTLITLEPAGVIFGIAPWNCPVTLGFRAVAIAILCGNTAILKSSEQSPRSQRFVAEIFRDAGFPKGVLNYVNMAADESPAMTERFIRHPAVRRVNFTGSVRVGKIIAKHCATYGPKPCILELGGKAPAVVLEDANFDAAADAIVFSSMMHSGQICFSTERVIVVGDVGNQFVGKLRSRILKLWSGRSIEANDQRLEKHRLGPLFNRESARRAAAMVEACRMAGAEILVGDATHTGCFMQPHLLDHVPSSTELFCEESFAPVCSVTRAHSVEEAIELANHGDFSLTAAVYGTNGSGTLSVAQQIKSGAVHINGPTVSFEGNRPYGGCGGASGYGRFGGRFGIDEYTDKKVITLNEPGGPGVFLI